MIWLKYEPGTFISTTKNSGRVAFWNVSKKSYKSVIKVADTPILFCTTLPDPSKLFFSTENGSVLIFDMQHKKNVFLLEPGHSQTVFDLEYTSLNYGVFATCSFDSLLKVWDLSSDKIINNFKVTDVDVTVSKDKKAVMDDRLKCSLFSLRWSHTDKNLLASGDSKGSIKIWDISKQKLVTSLKLNTKENANIIGIDWDKNNNILATSIDTVYICKLESSKLNLVKSIVVPCPVFQAKYLPYDQSSFAVGCQDGAIRIYKDPNDKPNKSLIGHSKKVFGLNFNPSRKGILASSSDDSKIGIWNLEKNTNFMMTGHTNHSRQLVWMSDFPHILISGSWDGTIRIWDIDLAECISMINEHYSDVYSLDISPHHPFLLTSTSRDNSVRFWSILSISGDYVKYFIAYKDITSLPGGLSGCHNILQTEYKMIQSSDYIAKADTISNYFTVNFQYFMTVS